MTILAFCGTSTPLGALVINQSLSTPVEATPVDTTATNEGPKVGAGVGRDGFEVGCLEGCFDGLDVG